ncbi:hypothetical protein HJC23_011216 [Cyclotella cryptica]|uniref:riboflavin kinase n=1 Tax=Cyclotella cryptica TaxID=29204 RepID=A0ABD3PXS4_9STRA|eukprot:CCRYP_011054-RA/>CCRYP_011054-RA protein AED:0.00 eAED:0.00 QI:290/1/1/1/0/0.5/2/1354/406
MRTFPRANLSLLLQLLTISPRIMKSRCLSLSHRNQRLIAYISVANNQRPARFSHVSRQGPRGFPHLTDRLYARHLMAVTVTNNSENEDQSGMKKAFQLLDTISSTVFITDSNGEVTAGSIAGKNTLTYSPTDDTPASNFGKTSQDEVEHYLEMLKELEGTSLSEESSLGTRGNDMILGVTDDDGSSDESDHPWSAINPILRLRGPVATGYGRGGKKLGVPTANLPASLFQSALENLKTGVYFGWAVIEGTAVSAKKGRNRPIKAVVNVGYSPTFEGKENAEKIVEAHLITITSPMTKYESSDNTDENIDNSVEEVAIEEDFYGETMRLQLIGFLRPERKFDSFSDLIAQIHCDIGCAAWALGSIPFVLSKEDEFIRNCRVEIVNQAHAWIGSGGGDDKSSWEFETW